MTKAVWCLIFGCIFVVSGGFVHDFGYTQGAGGMFACGIVLWTTSALVAWFKNTDN